MLNSFCALIVHVRYFKILTRLWGFRVKVANFQDSIVSQFPEETRAQRKPNLTKYRKMIRKPRSHVRILIYRTWAIRRLDGLYQWSRRCVRGPPASQAMSAISGMIKTKWSDIVLLKQRFQSHRNDPFAFRPKLWLLLSKVGLKTKSFGIGTGSFGRTGPTVQEATSGGGPFWPENFYADQSVPFISPPNFPKILL